LVKENRLLEKLPEENGYVGERERERERELLVGSQNRNRSMKFEGFVCCRV